MEALINVRQERSSVQFLAMFNLPYPADPILEPHLVGLTFGQVALMQQVIKAAEGDGVVLERILNRTEGTPINTNVNLNKNVTYQDFLDIIIKKEQAADDAIINVKSSGQDDAKPTQRESEKIS